MNTRPVGPAVDPNPAKPPGPVTLPGRYGTVERLDVMRHGCALWEALRGHDELWTYLFVGPFADEQAFMAWLAIRARDDSPYYFYTVLDRESRPIGLIALLEIRPATRVIEVGHILYSPALQRTALATESQYLLACYAFERLGYRRYEWKCDSLNAPSRRAAVRFGFTFEGIFRQHMIVKGRNRDTAWYSILDSEWPSRKAAFERWLVPENFDKQGQQKKKLGEA